MDLPRNKRFTIGPWQVEPHLHQIVAGDDKRRLEPRTMAVLVYFAKHPDVVISREELLTAVWGDCFVTENTLSQTISRLRRALGDDWQRPRFLETISKIGYRLVAPVFPLTEDKLPLPQANSPAELTPTGNKSHGLIAFFAGVLVFGMVAWVLRPPIAPAETLSPTVTPAITLLGRQHHPVLSPDGSQIAFAWQGHGNDNLDIFIQSIGAENPLRLTREPQTEVLPAWSSDGRHIAFASGGSGGCGLFQIPVTGGARERLADCLPNIRHIRWSPDGTQLVVDALSVDLKIQTIFRLNLASGEYTPLTQPSLESGGDWSPSFSPDQTHVAFIRRESKDLHHLYLMALQASDVRKITQHQIGRIRGFDWSADGKSLVYSSNRDGRFALWRHDLASGRETRLPINDEWVNYPSLARGKEALIYKNYVDVVDLLQVDLGEDGLPSGDARQVLSSTRSETLPRLSPDGERLAFFSNRTGAFELWSGELTGERLIRHTEQMGDVADMLAWSPDSAELVVHLRVQDQTDLFSIHAQGKYKQALTETAWNEANARYGQQKDRLYFASTETGEWQIWVMDRARDQKKMLTRDGGFFAQEGPESQFVYFTKLNHSELFRMPIDGGAEEVIWQGLDLKDWGNWQMCRSGLYYISRQGNRLMHQPLSKEAPREILKGAKTFAYLGPSFHIPADESKIFFSQITQSDDEIMLVNFE